MGSLVVLKALYGCSVGAASRKDMAKLRTAALEAVWGRGRLMRCKEIVFTFLSRVTGSTRCRRKLSQGFSYCG